MIVGAVELKELVSLHVKSEGDDRPSEITGLLQDLEEGLSAEEASIIQGEDYISLHLMMADMGFSFT